MPHDTVSFFHTCGYMNIHHQIERDRGYYLRIIFELCRITLINYVFIEWHLFCFKNADTTVNMLSSIRKK